MSKSVRYLEHPDKGVIAIYESSTGEIQAVYETSNSDKYFIDYDEHTISEMYRIGFTEVVI